MTDTARCVACTRRLITPEIQASRYACTICHNQTSTRLTELPTLYDRLNQTATLLRGAHTTSGIVTGSRTPPLPLRSDVLALITAGGIVTQLIAIEDAWRAALGWTIAPWRGSLAQTMPHVTRFLSLNLTWACSSYEEVGDDIKTIRKLHQAAKIALDPASRPPHVRVGPCPQPTDHGVCGGPVTVTGERAPAKCGRCGAVWPREEFGQLRDAIEAAARGRAAA